MEGCKGFMDLLSIRSREDRGIHASELDDFF